MQTIESESNKVSVKIYVRTRQRLKMRKRAIEDETGKEPDFADLIESAVAQYIADPKAVEEVPTGLSREEAELLEGVLDMARHPSDKQDEFMMMLLQEIIKIRNNAKRTKKS